MAGTLAGGRRAAETNKKRYGAEFYKNIGSKGGKKTAKDGTIKGFATNPELAAIAGSKGGKISKRGKKNA
jgi:general stress protein YciG